MKTVDLLERLRIVEPDATESDQPVGMLQYERPDAVQILWHGQQKGDTMGSLEPVNQLAKERRITVMVNMGIHQPGCRNKSRAKYQQDRQNLHNAIMP